ncbi:MAG: glycosyltransferase, partial [Armatimonadetes bacterium]|nr:glycosyltransferase [Armatimonadota bacterium]
LQSIANLGPGGAERQLVYSLLGIRALGRYNVGVLCQSLQGRNADFFASDLRQGGVEVHELHAMNGTAPPLEGAGALSPLWRTGWDGNAFGRSILDYMRVLRRLRPRVLHTRLDALNVRAGLAGVLVGVPRIVIGLETLPPVHFDFFQPFMRPIYRFLCAQPNVVFVCNSKAGARLYARWLGVDERQISVLYNGVPWPDASAYSEGRAAVRARLGIPASAAVVGSVMRLSSEKRPLLWLSIAAEMARRRSDVFFIVVGGGVLERSVRAEARRLGLTDRLVLTGVTTDPLRLMSAMDLFLLTSSREGLPNVLLEAQSLGLPVAAPPVGGVPEAMACGRSGMLLSSSCPEPCAEQILDALADESWMRTARREGAEFVRAFSMDRMIRETLQLYEIRPDAVAHP